MLRLTKVLRGGPKLQAMPVRVPLQVKNARYNSTNSLRDHMDENMPDDLDATQNLGVVPDKYEHEGRHERHHPDTLAGRSAQMFSVPEHLSKCMEEALKSKEIPPGALKRNVAQYYKGSQEFVTKMITSRENKLEAALTVAAATLHQNYGAAYAVLKELRQKMPEGWLPNSVLDVGLGASAGMMAVNEIFAGEEDWNPDRKTAAVLGPKVNTVLTKQFFDTQKHEDQGQNTFKDKLRNTRIQTGLPKGNSYKYDLVIASQQLDLLARQEDSTMEAFAARLVEMLSPGGVLVLVERGNPDGYERIARAREVLIRPMGDNGEAKIPVPYGKTRRLHSAKNAEEMQKLRQELGADYELEEEELPVEDRTYLHIIAPCSHHGKCPFQQGQLRNNPTAKGSWCSFTQKLSRPEYVMQLKRGKTLAASWDPKVTKNKNKYAGGGRPGSTDIEGPSFSYLMIQRSTSPDIEIPKKQQWPRILKPPLKRKNHVVMNICGPEGGLWKWTVVKSQGHQQYLDARKALQRDQWALDAKVKVPVRKNYQLVVENEKLARESNSNEPEINKKDTKSINQRRDLLKFDRRKQIKKARKEAKLQGKIDTPIIGDAGGEKEEA